MFLIYYYIVTVIDFGYLYVLSNDCSDFLMKFFPREYFLLCKVD